MFVIHEQLLPRVGPETNGPSRLINRLDLYLGVATSFWCLKDMCWRPCVALTLAVGYDAVDTPWLSVPGACLVSREPRTHRLGL